MAATDRHRWPSIPVADWQDTRDTLHLYTQVGRSRRTRAVPPTVDRT